MKHNAILSTACIASVALVITATSARAQFTLTILHNNDGESKLLSSASGGVSFGGVAHLAGLLQTERTAALNAGNKVIAVSSGDNFLAGATFQASLDSGAPGSRTFYDAIALSEIGYDAIAFGNHDFDFGPDLLSEFIGDVSGSAKYVATNVNFTGEPSLQGQVGTKIAPSVVVDQGGTKIGIIAALTPQLPTITSAGNVTVNPVVSSIQAAINDLQNNQGVQHIVLLSHLQGIADASQGDRAILAQLRGVDAVVSGGGSEFQLSNTSSGLKADPQHPLGTVLPTHRNDNTFSTYPTSALDLDGRSVPIVTTRGDYGYVGRIDLQFDNTGAVTGVATPDLGSSRSGPKPVIHTAPGVTPDPEILSLVTAPVQAFVNGLDATKLDASGVPSLDGRRNEIRSKETNVGNLLADSILWKAQQQAATFGADVPILSFTNGGGIRNNAQITDGEFTRKDTFDIAPFANFLSIIEDVTPQKLKSVLENAYSQTFRDVNGNVAATSAFTGRFAQISGFEVVYDLTQTGSTLNALGNVTSDGNRIVDVIFPDGTIGAADGNIDYLYRNGLLDTAVPGDFTLDVASIDFLSKGGDGYPLTDVPYTFLEGITYQQALQEFVQSGVAQGGLGGDVTSAEYGGALGRITAVPEPGSAALITLGLGILLARRRRQSQN